MPLVVRCARQHPRGSLLPLNTILTYVTQFGSALQHAHDQRLIHRDVKPENMLVEQSENILLSDFGIAVIARQHTQSRSLQEPSGSAAPIWHPADQRPCAGEGATSTH